MNTQVLDQQYLVGIRTRTAPSGSKPHDVHQWIVEHCTDYEFRYEIYVSPTTFQPEENRNRLPMSAYLTEKDYLLFTLRWS